MSAAVTSPFEAELLTHMPRLRQFARTLTRNEADAADLAQETLILALRAQDRFEPHTNMAAWLAVICRNRFLHERRARRHRHEHLTSEDADVYGLLVSPGRQEAAVMLREVVQAIATLTPRRRRMLAAVVNGENYEDEAAAMGITLGTFKSGSSRVRRDLRETFA